MIYLCNTANRNTQYIHLDNQSVSKYTLSSLCCHISMACVGVFNLLRLLFLFNLSRSYLFNYQNTKNKYLICPPVQFNPTMATFRPPSDLG